MEIHYVGIIHMYCHHNLILMFLFLENTAFILKLKGFQTEAWQSWMHAILAQWQLLRSNCKGYIGSDILEKKFSSSLKYSSHLNS